MNSKEDHTVATPVNFQVVFVIAVILTIVLGVYPDFLLVLR
jgi:hypothetical protein